MFAKSVLCLNTLKILQLAIGRTERLINGLITNIWERKSQAVIFSVLSSTETKTYILHPYKVFMYCTSYGNIGCKDGCKVSKEGIQN